MPDGPMPAQPGFGAFVRARANAGALVVQPRMGFGDPERMREGLAATKAARGHTVGTLTLDSYTRVGDLAAAEHALREDVPLNGYPIVSHSDATTRAMLAGVRDAGFPVQVRHGSALPQHIFRKLIALGLDATEGGPVSYCLPYGRTPLAASVEAWRQCTEIFSQLRGQDAEPHLETFGGCMMGQLCPPSQLVALSVLEAFFFRAYGCRSISVSYAQQTHAGQDAEAVFALRRLCDALLPDVDWHVVIYAYMGVYPVTDAGAYRLLGQAAELAVRTGSERLIVKTVAESRRIPTVAENVAALEFAARAAEATRAAPDPGTDTQTYAEALALVEGVLNLHPDPARALLLAFERGYLDIPYCVHPDNRGRTRSRLDGEGRLCWAQTGALPLSHLVPNGQGRAVSAAGLLADLSYMRDKADREAIQHRAPAAVAASDLR
ncbi:methylaspartate mutase E subunit [Streptomyces nodosus]|uniref:Methylaspartate mutase E subunit n=2 Tax=Streptomyces nodosus TaxID=40318 RepID=A0A0B5DQJ9_9ACTN|nr:methylaspartate mutase E subunit [Streptomyces nodosus]